MRRTLAAACTLAVLTAAPAAQMLTFKGAQLNYQRGDKKIQQEGVLHFEADTVRFVPKSLDKKHPAEEQTRALPYEKITGGEYTFGKSPRVAAALLVSPLFLMNSSKSHWLTIKTADDFAHLRLDKDNYKLVIAELEKRAKISVATVGEAK